MAAQHKIAALEKNPKICRTHWGGLASTGEASLCAKCRDEAGFRARRAA
jgi:hypothetical protein